MVRVLHFNVTASMAPTGQQFPATPNCIQSSAVPKHLRSIAATARHGGGPANVGAWNLSIDHFFAGDGTLWQATGPLPLEVSHDFELGSKEMEGFEVNILPQEGVPMPAVQEHVIVEVSVVTSDPGFAFPNPRYTFTCA